MYIHLNDLNLPGLKKVIVASDCDSQLHLPWLSVPRSLSQYAPIPLSSASPNSSHQHPPSTGGSGKKVVHKQNSPVVRRYVWFKLFQIEDTEERASSI